MHKHISAVGFILILFSLGAMNSSSGAKVKSADSDSSQLKTQQVSPQLAALIARIPRGKSQDFGQAPEIPSWLKDDGVVFGIGLNGEFRAYPRRIMEVHEMVNDTLGARDLATIKRDIPFAIQAK